MNYIQKSHFKFKMFDNVCFIIIILHYNTLQLHKTDFTMYSEINAAYRAKSAE